MLKKMSVLGTVLLAGSGIVLAAEEASGAVSNASDGNSYTVAAAPAKSSKMAATKMHKAKQSYHRANHSKSSDSDMDLGMKDNDYKNDGALATVPSCPACDHVTLNQGPYLGFSIGSRYNLFSAGSAYSGMESTLFAGYSMMWQQFYTAFELFGQDSSRIHDYKGSKGSAGSSWGYGVSMLPGYMFTDSFLSYMRLGMVRTRFASHNNCSNGAQAGIGIQTAISNSMEVRGEWDYTFYRSIGIGVPHTQQFNLGLVYKMPV